MSVSTQIRSSGFMPILALLRWNNLLDTIGMYPINLFTSRSQHKIFGQIPQLTSSQNLPPPFKIWSYSRGTSGTAPTINFLNCIQLIILIELFTKRLQNRRNQFWKIRVRQRSLHLRVQSVSLPNFLCMPLIVALQSYFDSPTVCEEIRCFPNTFTRF